MLDRSGGHQGEVNIDLSTVIIWKRCSRDALEIVKSLLQE